jgi:hypothetical protein
MDTNLYLSRPCRCRTKRSARYSLPQQARMYSRREQSRERRRYLPTEGPECCHRSLGCIDVQNTGDRSDRGDALLEHIGSGQEEQLLQGVPRSIELFAVQKQVTVVSLTPVIS